LDGEYFHVVLAFIYERKNAYGGGDHLEEEGAFIIHHFLIKRGVLVRSG
jgi:hypothetical protein